MDDVVIILEGETAYSLDGDANEVAEPYTRTVFGRLKSVTASEFLNAGKLGIKPSCMVEIYRAEYAGEKTAIVGNRRLTVYRTYAKGDRLELHLSERTGNAS